MADDADDEKIRRDVSDEELDIAYSGPAPGANRFFVTMGSTGVRLAFAEESSRGKVYFRNAVTLHPEDAIRLYRLIQDLLKDVEVQLKELRSNLPSSSGEEDG